jgi:signal transduction histidine kinase
VGGALRAEVARDPLELRALRAPEAVLAQLPDELKRADGDPRRLAQLELARANACRVIANWSCQRDAGDAARQHALAAGDRELEVRGAIAQARGNLALKDYARANQGLAEADALLKNAPNAELQADVYLGFSSLAFSVGKHLSSREYAQRGIDALAGEAAPGMRVRLLRNQARAQAQLGELGNAQASLNRALLISDSADDPKLTAEIFLESARIARQRGDQAGQLAAGERVLSLGGELKNSQLKGMGHEVLGLAALDAKRLTEARSQLNRAIESFRDLGLDRDELRSARELLAIESDAARIQQLSARIRTLDEDVVQVERAQAADDFAARIAYAETQTELVRVEGERKLALAREALLKRQAELTRGLVLLGALLVLGLAVWFWMQRRQNARLNAILKARSQALMNTSHELRNPIAGVLGLSELLKRTHLSPQQREMIDAIANAGESIGKLAQDLLDRGRIEEGRLKLKPKANSIGEVLKNLHLLHRPAAQQKGLKLSLNVDPSIPDQLLFDDHRLMQVLTNLLTNSVKFTERGEIGLNASRVEGGGADITLVRFTVSDTGVGISAADQARILEPFSKGTAGEQHRSGAGLGLAISNDLVRLMGGDIKIQSAPGGGTQMSFIVPFKRARTTDPSGPSRPREEPPIGLRVLMVEDDPDVAMLLERQLEVLGNQITVTHRGAQARKAAEIGSFDLVLIDAELPDANGAELARDLRALIEPRRPGLRVAIVSGHDAPERLPDGVDEWASKPVGLERLNMLMAAARR